MPAIQPTLLRRQAALLAEQFNQPVIYIRSLHHLLDYYAERARRTGQGGRSLPLIESYRVKPPVLRQIVFELTPIITENPQEAIILCDKLWVEPVYEFRMIAVMILGVVPPLPPEPIIQRLNQWVGERPEENLLNSILEQGCKNLRQQHPELFLDLVAGWLSKSETTYQQIGMRAMLSLVNDPDFDNFPIIFRHIQPYVVSVPSFLRPDLLGLLQSLAIRSPQETAYFLRHQLSDPAQKDVAFLIRQTAASFPDDIRQRLLNLVRIR